MVNTTYYKMLWFHFKSLKFRNDRQESENPPVPREQYKRLGTVHSAAQTRSWRTQNEQEGFCIECIIVFLRQSQSVHRGKRGQGLGKGKGEVEGELEGKGAHTGTVEWGRSVP